MVPPSVLRFPSLKRSRSVEPLQFYEHNASASASSTSSTCESSPTSAVFSENGKLSRNSFSSLTSSPGHPESPTFSQLTAKRSLPSGGLPDVAEESPESHDTNHFSMGFGAAYPYQVPRSSGVTSPRRRAHTTSSYAPPTSQPRFSHYSTDRDMSDLKRRRSEEQGWAAFASGVKSKLGSLSRHSYTHRRSATTGDERRSGYPSPASTCPPSRSASRAASLRNSLDGNVYEAPQTGTQIETIMEDDVHMEEGEGLGLFPSLASVPEPTSEVESDGCQIERKPTPLLPRYLDDTTTAEMVESPLQSPTVVSSNSARVSAAPVTPADSPRFNSPALSQHASTSSFHRPSGEENKRTSFVEPINLTAVGGDRWAGLLGHEDFTIYPEPYMIQNITISDYDLLQADWNEARGEFAKHRANTEAHYGASSRIYKWTQEKWDWIDSQWRDCNQAAMHELYVTGQVTYPSPKEPCPVANLPDLDDPRMQLCGGDIIGPMEVAPRPPPVRQPSASDKISAIFKPTITRFKRSFSGTY